MILSTSISSATSAPAQTHTVWGMNADQLHEQFWAAQGVQTVRTGVAGRIDRDASAYLLLEPAVRVLFHPGKALDRSTWVHADLLYLRLHDARESRYRERVVTDSANRFVRFERHYDGGPFSRLTRVLITPDPKVAAVWQHAADSLIAGRTLRQIIPRRHRQVLSHTGTVYLPGPAHEQEFVADLLRCWSNPDAAVARSRKLGKTTWADSDAVVSPDARLIGPVWIGAGRQIDASSVVVGPIVLWDEPAMRPKPQEIAFHISAAGAAAAASIGIAALAPATPTRAALPISYLLAKRTMDVILSILALLVTMPLYPIIMACIWFEDGRPFFFAHRRETLGGQKFPCIKFRSMRKDAEKVKLQLAAENQTDGPQWYMKHDPRLTRVGAFLRKRQLDELPQFINVLLGQMSLVGPRPSPFKENQFCPPWREARLSVRPGITGLWQVKRTRQADSDFQEWIKYDLEYVAGASMMLDLNILLQTALMFVRRQNGKASH
jgi:lipopolysaccharide/colanic/teichoic acid biosynthesis glycosyltransferase